MAIVVSTEQAKSYGRAADLVSIAARRFGDLECLKPAVVRTAMVLGVAVPFRRSEIWNLSGVGHSKLTMPLTRAAAKA